MTVLVCGKKRGKREEEVGGKYQFIAKGNFPFHASPRIFSFHTGTG